MAYNAKPFKYAGAAEKGSGEDEVNAGNAGGDKKEAGGVEKKENIHGGEYVKDDQFWPREGPRNTVVTIFT